MRHRMFLTGFRRDLHLILTRKRLVFFSLADCQNNSHFASLLALNDGADQNQ